MNKRKIWIDLDNSPHVPFFAPIIQALRGHGHEVVLTSRDSAQVAALAKLHGLESTQIGRHFGKNRLGKIAGTLARAVRLTQLMRSRRPDLAISHGSRSQIISSFLLGVPSVLIFDYEFTSSAGGISPKWMMAPDVIPVSVPERERNRWMPYPGIKEDVYVASFRPDPGFRARLGLSDEHLVVTIRPPASEAHYHNPQSEQLLVRVIEYVKQRPEARIILLPRTTNQDVSLRREWAALISEGKIIVPEVVDGLSLVWSSDLVVSGGGTMNREAAALGVPVYSIFRGTLGAVDKYLAAHGRLTLVENEADIAGKIKLVPRGKLAEPVTAQRPALSTILNNLLRILEIEAGQSTQGEQSERRRAAGRI